MATAALTVRSLGKRFELYDRPVDRLKQTLWRGRRRFFRDFWALRDVSFSLAPGQVLGVIGRNGSGKSTLLQLVAGTLAPTTGEVDTTGRIAALLELGSGFDPEFTGRENAFVNGAILGLAHAEMRALMPELIAFAGIGDFLDRPVKTYSSGMALRLAFAVATAVSPRILIVDEALAVGDEAFQRKCFARIEQMRESGTAILFVSHSPAQILELCDRALLLDAGEMIQLDKPSRVVPEYQRLLYATPANAARLRERLKDATPATDEAPAAVLDPDLRSASVVEFPAHGARIRSPRVTTLSGETVNVLTPGDEYVVRYEVEFERPARRVRFGMMIKTTSDVELGGSVYPDGNGLPGTIDAGARVAVSFAFRCGLFAGMYFLNTGVMGEADGTETYLHRLVDATAFRVQAGPAPTAAGYVDFAVRGGIDHERAGPPQARVSPEARSAEGEP